MLGAATGGALLACGHVGPLTEQSTQALRVHGAGETRAPAPVEPARNAKISSSIATLRPVASAKPASAKDERAGMLPTLELAANLAAPQTIGAFGVRDGGPCPRNMVSIGGRFCIDRYEASLVEVLPGGLERPFPYTQSPASVQVRAVSEPHVYPQAYISQREAKAACQASGKRLCKAEEWRGACRGAEQRVYPYGNQRQGGTCNDHGRSPLGVVYKGDPSVYGSWDKMNDPALNQVEGTLAKSGEHEACTTDTGIYDMVGNLHEWIDDPRGTFVGGYYLDTEQNGSGCGYTTDRHGTFYHDYSTGFRCCADLR